MPKRQTATLIMPTSTDKNGRTRVSGVVFESIYVLQEWLKNATSDPSRFPRTGSIIFNGSEYPATAEGIAQAKADV